MASKDCASLGRATTKPRPTPISRPAAQTGSITTLAISESSPPDSLSPSPIRPTVLTRSRRAKFELNEKRTWTKIRTAARRAHVSVEYKQDNIVISFSAAAFHAFHHAVENYLDVDSKQVDKKGRTVVTTLRKIRNEESHYTLSLYHTTSRVLINGPNSSLFWSDFQLLLNTSGLRNSETLEFLDLFNKLLADIPLKKSTNPCASSNDNLSQNNPTPQPRWNARFFSASDAPSALANSDSDNNPASSIEDPGSSTCKLTCPTDATRGGGQDSPSSTRREPTLPPHSTAPSNPPCPADATRGGDQDSPRPPWGEPTLLPYFTAPSNPPLPC